MARTRGPISPTVSWPGPNILSMNGYKNTQARLSRVSAKGIHVSQPDDISNLFGSSEHEQTT